MTRYKVFLNDELVVQDDVECAPVDILPDAPVLILPGAPAHILTSSPVHIVPNVFTEFEYQQVRSVFRDGQIVAERAFAVPFGLVSMFYNFILRSRD